MKFQKHLYHAHNVFIRIFYCKCSNVFVCHRGSSRTAYLNTGNKSKQIWQLLDRIFYTENRRQRRLAWKIVRWKNICPKYSPRVKSTVKNLYVWWKFVSCDEYRERSYTAIFYAKARSMRSLLRKTIRFDIDFNPIRNLLQNAIPRKIRRKKSSSSNGKDAIGRDPLRYRFPLRDHRTAVKVGKRCDRRWPRRWIVGWKRTFEIFIRSFRRVRSRYSRRCRDRGEKLGETRARVAPFQGEPGKRDRMRETQKETLDWTEDWVRKREGKGNEGGGREEERKRINQKGYKILCVTTLIHGRKTLGRRNSEEAGIKIKRNTGG